MEENVQDQSTTRSVGIRYGLILGVVSIVFFLILAFTGVDMNGPVRWLSYVMFIVFIYLAHKYYKENGTGFMSYGQGIGIAFWISLVTSIISSVFTYIYIKFVDTGFIDAIKEKQLEQFTAQGMSDEQIEKAEKFSSMFMNPEAFLVMGIIFTIIGIVITALIVTIFTQTKDAEQSVNTI